MKTIGLVPTHLPESSLTGEWLWAPCLWKASKVRQPSVELARKPASIYRNLPSLKSWVTLSLLHENSHLHTLSQAPGQGEGSTGWVWRILCNRHDSVHLSLLHRSENVVSFHFGSAVIWPQVNHSLPQGHENRGPLLYLEAQSPHPGSNKHNALSGWDTKVLSPPITCPRFWDKMKLSGYVTTEDYREFWQVGAISSMKSCFHSQVPVVPRLRIQIASYLSSWHTGCLGLLPLCGLASTILFFDISAVYEYVAKTLAEQWAVHGAFLLRKTCVGGPGNKTWEEEERRGGIP